MSCLHPIFNIVKLTLAPEDPISGQHPLLPPLLEIVDGEEEWVVEEILDSKVINWKLCYLVKWEGFGIEHNSLEPQNNLHALERVAEFHWKNPRTPWQIRFVDFNMIPFWTLTPVVLRRHSLEGGVDVRGHSLKLSSPNNHTSVTPSACDSLRPSHTPSITCPITLSSTPNSVSTLYIPPHHRQLSLC